MICPFIVDDLRKLWYNNGRQSAACRIWEVLFMKKIIAAGLALLMLLSTLTACRQDPPLTEGDTTTMLPTTSTPSESSPDEQEDSEPPISFISNLADPIVYDFDFLSTPVDGTVTDTPMTYDWKITNINVNKTKVEDSLWIIDPKNAVCVIQSEQDLAIDPTLYPTFRVKLLNQTEAAQAMLYFTTDADNKFTEDKSLTLTIQPNDTVYREYMFDMSEVAGWTGMINRVRLVIGSEEQKLSGPLRIDSMGFYPGNIPADVVLDFSESLAAAENVTNATAEGVDVLRLTPTGGNASFETVENLGLRAAAFRYVRIYVQNATSAKRLRVSFVTEDSPDWSEDKSILLEELKGIDSGLTAYAFYMPACKAWRGTIQRIRVTFEDTKAGDGSITIPYMDITTQVILDDVVYDFGGKDSLWTADGQGTVSLDSNAMKVEMQGEGTAILSPELSINADELVYLTLRLENNTAASSMKIQWMNEGDTAFDEIKTQNILIKPHSGMQDYVIAIGDHQRWLGTVTRLRITPALYTVSGDVRIESLRFSQNGDASFAGRQVAEGALEIGQGWTYNTNGGQITGDQEKTGTTSPESVGLGTAMELSNDGPGNTLGYGVPTEAWCSVARYTDGYIQWPVELSVTDPKAEGNTLRLINTETGRDVIRLSIRNGVLKAALPQGEKDIATMTAKTRVKFMLYMNMETHTYDLWLNAQLIEKDVPFTTAESFDQIYVGTGGESKVVLGYTGGMYRVNELYEDFSQFSDGDVKSGRYTTSGRVVVSSQQLVVGGSSASSFAADFVPASNVIEANLRFLIKEKADGMRLSLSDGKDAVATIQIKGNDILYVDGNGQEKVLWKEFRTGLTYSLKIRVYTELDRVEYSINGCSSKDGGWENVNGPAVTTLPGGAATVNALSVSTAGKGTWEIDSIRILDYTPSTVPAIDATNDPENGYIGVNAWSASNMTNHVYQKSQRIADKESVIGYFNNVSKEALNWQIKYMAENGIDFAAFYHSSLQVDMEATYLDYAEYNDAIRFAMIFDSWCATTEASVEETLWPFMLERLLRNPNYITYQGQPVVFIAGDLLIDVTATMNKLEQLAVDAGWDGLIFVNVCWVDDTVSDLRAQIQKILDMGYDYVTNYWKSVSAGSIKRYMRAAKGHYIPAPGVGADSRCWSTLELSQSPFPYIYSSPSDFYNALVEAKEQMEDQPEDTLASKMILAENWSEFGEGHSIMPFGEFGFGYINQIRRVFGSNTDENLKNATPSGKVDHLYSLGWNTEQLSDRGFETGVGDWRADGCEITVVGTTDFHFLKSAANVTGRASEDSGIEQDITSVILRNGRGAVYDVSAYLQSLNTAGAANAAPRYLTFLGNANSNLALTYRPEKQDLTMAYYDESNEYQCFVVRSVPGELNQYQIYSRVGYEEDENGNVIAGKIIVTVDEWPDEHGKMVYSMALLEMWDVSDLTANTKVWSYFTLPENFYEGDIVAINAGKGYRDGRSLFRNLNVGESVYLVLDWGGVDQRWIIRDRDETPKLVYRAGTEIVLEITDSAGTHSYIYKGNAALDTTVKNGAQFKVDWTGELVSAVLKINGDTTTAEGFVVDECRFRLVPKQYAAPVETVVVR